MAADGPLTGDLIPAPADPRIDPLLDWALATNFAAMGGGKSELFPLLLELDEPATEFWGRIGSLRLEKDVRIAPIYQAPPAGSERSRYCTVLVTRDVLRALANGRDVPDNLAALLRHVVRIELCSPVVPPFEPQRRAAPPQRRDPPARAAAEARDAPIRPIVAVIDDGIAFAHERFCDGNGRTRFTYFWNQDDAESANGPLGFNWGRELGEAEINQRLAGATRCGLVDEDALYAEAGQDLAGKRRSHGTHVMDIACGANPRDASIDWDRMPYLIGVQLPRWATAETSGRWLTGPALDALLYVLDRADAIRLETGVPNPVVVNLSYGKIAGPHDGQDLLESAIDALIGSRQAPLRVVLPAGNHYAARCHAVLELPAATAEAPCTQTLHWRAQPDDGLWKFMQIWLPHAAPGQPAPKLDIRIAAPSGQSGPWIGPGQAWSWSSAAGIRFFATYRKTTPPGGRPRILLAMAPTIATETDGSATAPSGTWAVEIRNAGRKVKADAWVERGDAPFGYRRRGRQSRFEDPEYILYDGRGRIEEDDNASCVRRRGSLSAMASGRHALVVGGFRRSDYRAALYSGAGPIVAVPPPWRDGPDVTAVSDDSPALRGVLAAGSRSGSLFAMNGTSVAAPQITRLIAERMAAGEATDNADIQTFAHAGEPHPSERIPAQRGGSGRVEREPRVARRWQRW